MQKVEETQTRNVLAPAPPGWCRWKEIHRRANNNWMHLYLAIIEQKGQDEKDTHFFFYLAKKSQNLLREYRIQNDLGKTHMFRLRQSRKREKYIGK